MKFTLSWLKQFLDTKESLHNISATLTRIGFEVESIIDRAHELEIFSVAKILEATPHPSADKLKVCVVETKSGNLQIVCGAPNARAGIKVVLAPVGAIIPNGNFTIKKAKIRDVESSGMMCSYEELLLDGDSSGIIELPEDAKVGEKAVKYLGGDDPIIEISVTPNRGDALGVYGIARDLAAAGIGKLKAIVWEEMSVQKADIIENTKDCPAFVAIEVNGLNNCESPTWLQNLLKSIGCKPISAIVDVTNYFLFCFRKTNACI
jgi:phenylalanyl-tRNA synthetase beta chain